MRLSRLAILFSLLSLTAWIVPAPQHAHAQETPAAKVASAKEAFKRGEAAYSAGAYEVAVKEWTNAYALDPKPLIQFNLSQAYERMGRTEDAIASLKRFLESSSPDESAAYSDANARLVSLQQRLAATGVVVEGAREGGSILVDDQDWGRTPRPDKITVAPGNHVLVIRWPDGKEFRTNVFVPAGQVINIQAGDGAPASVAPGPTAQPQQPAPYAQPSQDDARKKKILFYSIGGGVAAVGAGLFVYGIVRGGADSDCGKVKDGSKIYCNPDSVDSIKTQSIVGYVSGGVLLAGGAALMVVGALTGRHEDQPRAQSCDLGLTGANCTFRF